MPWWVYLWNLIKLNRTKLFLRLDWLPLGGRGWGGEVGKINIFLRICLRSLKTLCMVVSSSKIIIIDGTCGISLRLLRKFQNYRFSGAAIGHQNRNIMTLAHVIHHWKRNLMLINCYKRSTPLKWIVLKLYAISTIQQHRWYTW